MPVLPSRDVDAAVNFWCDKLGFELINSHEHKGRTAFSIVRLGAITVALQRIDDFKASDGWSAYLYVSDAKMLAAKFKSKDVMLEHDVHDTFYGMKEFDLRTPDGHGIAFGQDIGATEKDPGL